MKTIVNASVRSAGVNSRHAIETGGHQLVADEPVSAGAAMGTDLSRPYSRWEAFMRFPPTGIGNLAWNTDNYYVGAVVLLVLSSSLIALLIGFLAGHLTSIA